MQTDNSELLFSLSNGAVDTSAVFAKVLLIEDEAGHAALIQRALRGVVGSVEHVSDGKSAIEAISNTLPELVLCDLHLPDISGVDLVESIRSARPDLPIIVMTSSSRIEDAVSVMRSGAWDYMVKEFEVKFQERLQLVIVRTAERKVQQLREFIVRAERDAFSAAVRTAQDGMAVLERNGEVTFANESFYSFCSLLDYDSDSGEMPNIISLLGSGETPVSQQLAEQLELDEGDLLWRTEVGLEDPRQEEEARYFELVLSSIIIGGGEGAPGLDVRRYVIWVRDITRKKEQEKFQRDVLSSTSHDLKGPLGAILTSVELLSDPDSLGKLKSSELITRVGSCARNCVNLIDELLSARRIQDGVLVVRPREYKVNELLEDIVLDYLQMAKAKNIELKFKPTSGEISVYADKLGLHRVLSNLVSNAIKFTDNGGVITLSGRRGRKGTRIVVSDTGCGIEPEALPNLFSKYSRLDKHTEVDGTGLGLFVTKNIMDAHNGTVEVQSQVGVGTTITLAFPDATKNA